MEHMPELRHEDFKANTPLGINSGNPSEKSLISLGSDLSLSVSYVMSIGRCEYGSLVITHYEHCPRTNMTIIRSFNCINHKLSYECYLSMPRTKLDLMYPE